ncbi:MAG: chemotaxis protein CheW, partial [Exilispira sp.]
MAEIHINNVKQIIDKENAISTGKKSFNAAIQIVRFYIDNFEFALDIMDVKEIKEMDKIRNLPNALPFVKGLLNLRGDIIPILDLKKKLELENLSLKDLANLGEKQKEKNEITSNDKEIIDIVKKTDIKSVQNEKE